MVNVYGWGPNLRHRPKLWGFCHTLRHDGIDYADYIERITYLLFRKVADVQASPRSIQLLYDAHDRILAASSELGSKG
jgi:hypothetical protein